MPGSAGPAAWSREVSSRSWEEASTATETPCTSRRSGAKASASSRPTPTIGIGAPRRAARVWAKTASPKSAAWLLAMLTASTPARARVSRLLTGARNAYALPGRGAPPSPSAVSRLTIAKSARPIVSRSAGGQWRGVGEQGAGRALEVDVAGEGEGDLIRRCRARRRRRRRRRRRSCAVGRRRGRRRRRRRGRRGHSCSRRAPSERAAKPPAHATATTSATRQQPSSTAARRLGDLTMHPSVGVDRGSSAAQRRSRPEVSDGRRKRVMARVPPCQPAPANATAPRRRRRRPDAGATCLASATTTRSWCSRRSGATSRG